MKKLILGLISLSLLGLTGCDFSGEGSDTIKRLLGLDDVSFTSTDTWTYNSSGGDTFIVDESVNSITISGDIGGKNLYLAEVNTSDSSIAADYIKYMTSTNSNRSAAEESEEPLQEVAAAKNVSSGRFKHYVGYNFKPDPNEFSSARSIASPSYSVTQIDRKVGTKKSVFIANSSSDDTARSKASATLWAFNDTCNVWVVDSDKYLTSDTEKQKLAEKFAAAFAAFYPVVTNVFGKELDEIYTKYVSTSLLSGEYTTSDMTEVSNTGEKINIVIYDLFADGEGGNVLGFFSSGDYYAKDFYSYSNVGKYFYVDSYFATQEESVNTIISTLAHEFQHMVHFGVKGNDTDTNFNEMLSMLCEDMMQEFLTDKGYTIEDKDSPKSRMLEFMIEYFGCGIRGYDNSSLAYANAYAFGSWLCRQYGGAALVKEMMSNDYTNNECIVAAVNELNGTSFTFDDLFAQFIKACYGKDSEYTFNKDAAKTITYSSGSTTYDYPMTAINLWEPSSMYNLNTALIPGKSLTSGESLTYRQYIESEIGASYIDSQYKYFGPLVFNANTLLTSISQSYGMALKRKSTVIPSGTNSYTITFSSKSGYTKTGMKLFLYIK